MEIINQEDIAWGAWVTQLAKCLTLGFGSGHDIGVMGRSPTSHSMLSTEPAIHPPTPCSLIIR